MINGETKKVLITVKAYPNPSKKYVETVCVAGIDISKNEWVRLYPIPYRDLDEDKKFRKYSIIQVRAKKPRNDRRPESYRIDMNSIKILDYLDPRDKWIRRKNIVLPTVDNSMCEILRLQKREDKSLGVFKPCNVNFIWTKGRPKDERARKACYAQLRFFDKKKDVIETIPFWFRYTFSCSDEPMCPGHDYLIIDWEIGQTYRKWRRKYGTEDVLLEKIREQWLIKMCSPKRDFYFFVGNTKRFRETFMILGVFYPPKNV